MRLTAKRCLRYMALVLVLASALSQSMPAHAGFWSWLTGQDAAVEESTTATPESTPSLPTLPPAEALDEGTAALEAEPTPATPTPSPAPIVNAALSDDGLLRVELRSLNDPSQLHLTLAGIYTVESDAGFRFERDTRVTLSAADGNVYLAVGGLTINMGNSLTLTRHRSEEGAENGLYIDESEKETLYCGDLSVACVEGNSLRAILKIQVEDYLYGVVAYEMSDSFPLEALKAQAVAARTYAMQRKYQSAGRDYDLVDTTADQVYKGYSAEYANVIQAVDATRGVVGLFNGTFAVCYYTASNGGQTALASQIWGSIDSDGYLTMTDDPYDVENPRSMENTLTIMPGCEGSDVLKEMLEAALGRQLAAEGFAEGEWALDSIVSVKPVEPRFEGSRMYDGLAFELRPWLLLPETTPVPESTPEAADATESVAEETPAPTTETVGALAAVLSGQAEPETSDEPAPEITEVPKIWRLSDTTYTVILNVYDEIKDKLSLGLNSSDYELISVRTESDSAGAPISFTLIMRRFGHGVGMSQRGAQWMAGHYDMNWRQILAFYYPGMSLERMTWPEQTLTDLAALPEGVGAARPAPTATPTPAPLPELEAGEHYAKVIADWLNVREQPTTAARALDRLPRGRRIIVCGEMDDDGWVPIRTAELHGYVKAEYLE